MATALLEPTSPLTETATPDSTRSPSWNVWVNRLAWTVLLLGLGWRILRYLVQFPLWGDEAHLASNFLDRDILGLTRKLDYGQVAPVLFLWIEWLAYHLWGPSELALRFFPLLAGLAGLILFRRCCHLTLPSLAATLAVSLLAVSYYPVRHATEIKPYSFDLLMPLVLLLPAIYWLQAPQKIGWLMLMTALTPFAIGISYPAIFVAGAISLVLFPQILKSWKNAETTTSSSLSTLRSPLTWFLIFNLAMVTTFLAHLMLVGREQLDSQAGTVNTFLQQYWQDWFPPANWLEFPLWLVKAHTGNMLAYPVGGPHGGSTLTFLLCLAGIWTLWHSGQRQLLSLCLLPFVLSLVAALLHRYPYGGSARLAQHLAPFICMLAGTGIAQLLQWLPHPSWQQRWTITILACLAVVGLTGILMTWKKPFKLEGDVRIRKLAREITAKKQPGDAIVVFNHPDFLRPQMVWYLRLLGLPLTWQSPTLLAGQGWPDGIKPDWPAIDSQQNRLWAINVRFAEEKKPPPEKLLSPSHAGWTVAEHQEYIFPPDSKDVPLQYCDVYLLRSQ